MEAGKLPEVERHGAVMAEREPGARKLFWSEVAVAALLGLTACAAAWSAYKATLVRDVRFDCQKYLQQVEHACD